MGTIRANYQCENVGDSKDGGAGPHILMWGAESGEEVLSESSSLET